ncbi:1-phosphofructokinase family hexose kinase [Lutibacter sp. B1]|uniref:1-phosphofructokinase family hexose kinase n=1 Tax=Lutibacter sp. B1 TaxID=2725996 RepID=UPI0014572F56|nr:1-phosphofructokinase family hexose kinase [Lutibacter sp. B1]
MNIITLTLNPALDKSAKINGLVPEQKLRCHSIINQPGGGGVNISRLLKRLQINTVCMVILGGDTGTFFEELLIKEEVKPTKIVVKTPTRENFSVVDTQTGLQYRFGMPSNEIFQLEMDVIKNTLLQTVKKDDILVLSGSLPESMPTDFYAQLIKLISNVGAKIILDTSGKPLAEAIKEKVFLIKPNQKELAQLAGKDFLTNPEQEAFALQLVNSKQAEYVVVSLGARGAFMASKDGVIFQTTPSVKVNSTIGAGDSMVAGLIYALQNNLSPKEVLKWGVACGVATTMSEGTNLASVVNINRALKLIK